MTVLPAHRLRALYERCVRDPAATPAGLLAHVADTCCHNAEFDEYAYKLLEHPDTPPAVADRVNAALTERHRRAPVPVGARAQRAAARPDARRQAAWLLRPERRDQLDVAALADAPELLALALTRHPGAPAALITALLDHEQPAVAMAAAAHSACPHQLVLDRIATLDEYIDTGCAAAGAPGRPWVLPGITAEYHQLRTLLGTPAAAEAATDLVETLRTVETLPVLAEHQLDETAKLAVVTRWLAPLLAGDWTSKRGQRAVDVTDLLLADRVPAATSRRAPLHPAPDDPLAGALAGAWRPHAGRLSVTALHVLDPYLDPVPDRTANTLWDLEPRSLAALAAAAGADPDDPLLWVTAATLADEFTGTLADLFTAAAGVAHPGHRAATA